MFQLFDPTALKEKAPRWAKRLGDRYPLIFGLSPFGHLFVCSQDGSEFAVIATERPELFELKSEGMTAFVDEFLGNDDVRVRFFRRPQVEALVSRLGPLSKDECFYPVPYPALGGSGSLETYARGNAWVHLDLLGQSVGL